MISLSDKQWVLIVIIVFFTIGSYACSNDEDTQSVTDEKISISEDRQEEITKRVNDTDMFTIEKFEIDKSVEVWVIIEDEFLYDIEKYANAICTVIASEFDREENVQVTVLQHHGIDEYYFFGTSYFYPGERNPEYRDETN